MDNTQPPRTGEGDHAKHGGGVFSTTRQTIDRARCERRSGNPPEILLWRALKLRPGGFKFRRQHPIGPYSLDFACLSARLAIEIDGEAYDRSDAPDKDQVRDRALMAHGFRTLRIPARDVMLTVDDVVVAIVTACQAAGPLHHPPMADGPPPRAGEV